MSHKLFRGISIPSEHFELAKNLYALTNLTDELNSLQSTWNNLSLLGELTNIGAEISKTRQDFQTLANELSNCLIDQSVSKVSEELSAKAQSSIDILVRNLFERTADIGFLATDEHLKTTCANANAQTLDESLIQDTLIRLKHYQSKYSVYSNIFLLNAKSELILDMQQSLQSHINLDWIAEGVQKNQNYFEAHRTIEPSKNPEKSLIYAWKLEKDHTTIGYVCLSFNLDEEKDAITKQDTTPSASHKQSWMEFGVIDQHNRIIFSTDKTYLSAGTQIPVCSHQNWHLAKIGPVAYLCCIRSTHGYQGYMGPGWAGFALIPLSYAFEDSDSAGESEKSFPNISWDRTNQLL